MTKPVLVYPTDGQRLDFEGDYPFRVQPIPLAAAYRWEFYQYGNEVLKKTVPDVEFSILQNSPDHDKFGESSTSDFGLVSVSVSAYVDGAFTETTNFKIRLLRRGE